MATSYLHFFIKVNMSVAIFTAELMSEYLMIFMRVLWQFFAATPDIVVLTVTDL